MVKFFLHETIEMDLNLGLSDLNDGNIKNLKNLKKIVLILKNH